MAIYSIVQRHAIDPYMWGGVITWQRVIGTIGQPNFLAAYMLMAFFLTLALILMEKPEVAGGINWYDQLFPLGYYVFTQVAFLVMIYNLEAHNFVLWYFAFSLVIGSAMLFTYYYERLHPRVLNLVLGLSLFGKEIIKFLAQKIRIKTIDRIEQKIVFKFFPTTTVNLARMTALLERYDGSVTPQGVMNDVFSMSSSAILIWL